MDAVVDAATAAKTMRGVCGASDGPAQMPASAPEGSTSTSVPATEEEVLIATSAARLGEPSRIDGEEGE